MDRQEALAIFEQFGARLFGGSLEELRSAWITLARRHHARANGDATDQHAMAEINAAYDVLKRGYTHARGNRAITDGDPRIHGVCVWAWAGHPGGTAPPPDDSIGSPDERDANFVKRRIWQLSGGSKEEWTIWCFDGRRFMAPLTVYGSRDVFGEMACMALRFARVGFRRPRAAFVQRHDQAWADLLLIHSDGTARAAIPFRHNGGAIPPRDQAFVSRLPALLDELDRSTSRP